MGKISMTIISLKTNPSIYNLHTFGALKNIIQHTCNLSRCFRSNRKVKNADKATTKIRAVMQKELE